MERYSRSPSPYRAPPRHRYRPSSPVYSRSPSPYRAHHRRLYRSFSPAYSRSRSPSPYRAPPRHRYRSSSPVHSRSPSPHRAYHRCRYRSISPPQSPTSYRWRSPQERSRRERSFQRHDSHGISDSRRETSRRRVRSRYPDHYIEYIPYRSPSIDRYARQERPDDRGPSPLYYMQSENGSTRVFKEVTRLFPGSNLDPRTIYDISQACTRDESDKEGRLIPIKQENWSSNHFGDHVASYHGPDPQQSRWAESPARNYRKRKLKAPNKRQQALLLRGRAPRNAKQRRWLREYQSINLPGHEWPPEDAWEPSETYNDQWNTAFENDPTPLVTYPQHNRNLADQHYPQRLYESFHEQECLHPPTRSQYWTNQHVQHHRQSFGEQERLQIVKREDVQEGAPQQRHPYIEREPMVDSPERTSRPPVVPMDGPRARMGVSLLSHTTQGARHDAYIPHHRRVQPPIDEAASSFPCLVIKQEHSESLPSSPMPSMEQESVEPHPNELNHLEGAYYNSSEKHIEASRSSHGGFWVRILQWIGL
ncbi:hypothetical protein PMIN03_003277 [Paraphaeosphaeria minitans]